MITSLYVLGSPLTFECFFWNFQTRRAEFHGSGLIGSFRTISRTEGLLGFYRLVLPALLLA